MPDIKPKPERGIVAAACQIEGLTISLPAPARHHDILRSMWAAGIKGEKAQGFLDHRGVFLGRRAAMITAHAWGQLAEGEFQDGGELFSEHLW